MALDGCCCVPESNGAARKPLLKVGPIGDKLSPQVKAGNQGAKVAIAVAVVLALIWG